MIKLYTEKEFENAKSNNKLKLECVICHKEFLKLKRSIQSVIRGDRGCTGLYCSKKCNNISKTTKKIVKCKKCSIEFFKVKSDIKENNFCSHSCSASYNNSLRHYSEESNNKRILKLQILFKVKINCAICDKEYEIETNNSKLKNKRYNKYCNNCTDKINKGELNKIYPKITEEAKFKMSESKKKLYKIHPEKHPNVRCAKNIESYPEKFFKEFLELNNIYKDIDYKQNYKIDKYYVDFYFFKLNLSVEIDGERWHDRNDNREIERENKIKEKTKIIRFWSKKLIKKQYETEIIKIINDIKNWKRNCSGEQLCFENKWY